MNQTLTQNILALDIARTVFLNPENKFTQIGNNYYFPLNHGTKATFVETLWAQRKVAVQIFARNQPELLQEKLESELIQNSRFAQNQIRKIQEIDEKIDRIKNLISKISTKLTGIYNYHLRSPVKKDCGSLNITLEKLQNHIKILKFQRQNLFQALEYRYGFSNLDVQN